MPYIFWGGQSIIENQKRQRQQKSSSKKDIDTTDVPAEAAGTLPQTAGKGSDDVNASRRQNGAGKGKEAEEVTSKNFQWTSEEHPDSSEFLHHSLTLDQYYYESLSNTEERDNSQVIKQFFKTENTASTKPAKKELNSKSVKRESSTDSRSGKASTRSGPKPQILIVNQLWLWILGGMEMCLLETRA